ncbi:twin-arginine translocase TatA/TatE family subunit [Actinopolymorpha rutila]|uniref:twin-arginine translocase TatA/TatE family subunit n=1 Tax=Actinopolymorpha rutila TaxID=446787 RepID=UPI001EE2623D|nr:twin-arginine translocase TatA/TatE family subunit [Actinopolymorpha rutila]
MLLRNGLEPWHLLIVLVAFIALFGPKRLPGAAKGIAQSLRIFKSEIRSTSNADTAAPEHAEPTPAPSAAPPAATTSARAAADERSDVQPEGHVPHTP